MHVMIGAIPRRLSSFAECCSSTSLAYAGRSRRTRCAQPCLHASTICCGSRTYSPCVLVEPTLHAYLALTSALVPRASTHCSGLHTSVGNSLRPRWTQLQRAGRGITSISISGESTLRCARSHTAALLSSKTACTTVATPRLPLRCYIHRLRQFLSGCCSLRSARTFACAIRPFLHLMRRRSQTSRHARAHGASRPMASSSPAAEKSASS